MMNEERIDRRTREGREQARKTQRRRRVDNLGVAMNLAITGELDRDRYEYRWINDNERARLQMMTQQDDWDVVSKSGDGIELDGVKSPADALGDAVTRIVGAKKDGSPQHAYLCRKPKELYDADKAAKQRRLDEIDDAIKGNAKFEGKGPVADDAFYDPTRR